MIRVPSWRACALKHSHFPGKLTKGGTLPALADTVVEKKNNSLILRADLSLDHNQGAARWSRKGPTKQPKPLSRKGLQPPHMRYVRQLQLSHGRDCPPPP